MNSIFLAPIRVLVNIAHFGKIEAEDRDSIPITAILRDSIVSLICPGFVGNVLPRFEEVLSAELTPREP